MTRLWQTADGLSAEGSTEEEATENFQNTQDTRKKPVFVYMKSYPDYDDFRKQFGIRQFKNTASGNPETLETYGKEMRRVQDYVENPKTRQMVWTVITGDSGLLWVCAGYHLVNRINYVITKKPWVTSTEEFLW